MIIINNDRKVISHYGVKGMKWGIRKDSKASARRSKAQNILNKYSDDKTMNKRDLKDAEYMSMTLDRKLAKNVTIVAASTIAQVLIVGKFFGKDVATNPKMLKSALFNVARNATVKTLTKEVSGRGALKRYKDTGEKDLSKKQYRKNAITPNRLLSSLIATGVYAAPYLAGMGAIKATEAMRNRAENQARVDKWGSNILPEPGKGSKMHTIYDDGYMSILERIKP